MKKKVIFKSEFMQIDWVSSFPDIIKGASARELENELNNVIQTSVLPLIDKGLSPVSGARTFAKYKDKKKYPGKLKPSNKPNLKLTGEMLSNYKAKGYNQGGTLSGTMGIHKDASQRSKLLTKVHNKGDNPNIPMRPFIPKQIEGETYTAKITAAIRKAFRYVLGRAITNNKGRGQR